MPLVTSAKPDKKVAIRKAPTQERARARVERILEVAQKLLVSEGYEKLSTNLIAKQAKVPIGSLYQYFPNKQSIILELNNRWLEAIRNNISSYDTDALESDKPKVVLKKLISEILNLWIDTDNKFYSLELSRAMAQFPELDQEWLQHKRKIADILASIYRRLGIKAEAEQLVQLGHISYGLYGVYWDLCRSDECEQEILIETFERALIAVIEPYCPN